MKENIIYFMAGFSMVVICAAMVFGALFAMGGVFPRRRNDDPDGVVPYAIVENSPLPSGFYFLNTKDGEAFPVPGATNATVAWELFTDISSAQPDFHAAISGYTASGFCCILSKQRRGRIAAIKGETLQ